MSLSDTSVPARLMTGARPLVDDLAREVQAPVGFVIYHRARPANFVLAHLWEGVDLIQRYWTSPLNAPEQLRAHRSGAIRCVWELEIIAQEREAWAAVCELPNAAEAYLHRT